MTRLVVHVHRHPRVTTRVKYPPDPMKIWSRGGTWDWLFDTDEGDLVYADTTWGNVGYFMRGTQWYRFRL